MFSTVIIIIICFLLFNSWLVTLKYSDINPTTPSRSSLISFRLYCVQEVYVLTLRVALLVGVWGDLLLPEKRHSERYPS